MNAQDLKNSILHLAIQGKLVEQREEEGTAKELLEKIEAEKKQLIKEGKIKKQKALPAIKADEIPFYIPESWEWVRLNDLALFIKAGGDKPRDFTTIKSETHSVPVIANGIQNDGIIGYTKNATVEDSCITVSGRGTIGFSCLRTEPFTPVVRLLVLNISNEIEQKYIQNVLTALLERGVGTSIKQLTVPMLQPKLIPLPPLEEQKRIVAKIEELMPYVVKYEKAYFEVEELNKKFPYDMQKSILQYAIQGKLVEQREEDGTGEDFYRQIQDVMKKQIQEGKVKKPKKLPEITDKDIPFDIPENWKWVRLGEIGFTNIGLTYKPSDISNNGTIVLRSSNIQNGQLDYNDLVKVSSDIPITKMCQQGDILICARNGSKRLVGKAALMDKDGMSFGAFMAIYRSLCNEYILHIINSAYFRNTMLPETGTTTINQITQETLRHCMIPLPPLAEQKRIVEKIEELLPYTKQLVKYI
ncbi:restriction endonuclease subunit S [Bacillus canaveralius]|uniref:restriction endonuclease subunit S n=1 Tax=Bacillus canaveralius TaxID=1403243 RepID=UPI000F768F7A|nr:restriction endonuclease subunit S [Bacillus canaveralius]RSK49696.1 restriction endonuclease subunit S [Bacillus canaveralius]